MFSRRDVSSLPSLETGIWNQQQIISNLLFQYSGNDQTEVQACLLTPCLFMEGSSSVYIGAVTFVCAISDLTSFVCLEQQCSSYGSSAMCTSLHAGVSVFRYAVQWPLRVSEMTERRSGWLADIHQVTCTRLSVQGM